MNSQQPSTKLRHNFKVLRKIVMVATTGRSGSLFFANLINHNALNATAEHEPRLVCSDASTKWYYDNDTQKISRLVSKKLHRLSRGDRLASLPVIRQAADRFGRWPVLRKAMGIPRVPVREIYVEVNNSFLKSYGPTLMLREPAIEVIHLTRNPLQMAKSAANRGSFPDPSRPYYLWPSWSGNELVLAEEMSAGLSPFQLGLWYWIEMELRFAALCERHPEMKKHDIDLDQLNDLQKVEQLFEALGIRHSQLSARVDTHKGAKPNVVNEDDLNAARELMSWLPSDALGRISNTYGLENL